MAKFVIRSVTPNDSDSLATMWLELVASHRALDANLPLAARDGERRYVNRIMERLDDPYTCVLISEVNDQPVGYILAMIVDLMPDIFAELPAGFIADLFVNPLFRRRGIGRSLVGNVKDWFRQSGVKYFDWQVAAQNKGGQAFWRSIGGQDVMTRMRAHLGVNNDPDALPDE